MFVALGIKHTRRMRRIVVCGLSGCTVFFHIIISNGTILGGKLAEYKNVRFDFLYNFCLKHFSF